MRFRSKVDAWLLVVMVGAALAVFLSIRMASAEGLLPPVWVLAVILALTVVLPVWLLAATHYTFTEEQLVIRSGPFRWRIPLRDIRSADASRNPVSSPALSLDRLRIDYGSGRVVYISPRDREGFLRELESRRHGGSAITP